ncbi:MAG: Do family serine endopeptidase [Gammaproteobacteria bacterium]|nr:Do family serine endopeptidase [Gammaproteobacteria bacterium]MDE0224483.1 Do family serine endopeptidase [Gammaproteobacteria bacterium]MDE0453355.1 Do family serine endopeptidase [Gammaproteobacteria bacterium]
MAKSVPGVFLTLLALSFSLSVSNHAAEKLTAAPAVKKAAPAVVHISVFGQARGRRPQVFDFFQFPMPDGSPGEPVRGTGSGVIIDAGEGHVITNHHVIDNAEQITVRLDDRRILEAELIGSDPGTDIALLRIEAENVSELPLGDSETLEIGDFVVAIGSPFNLDQTVTLGIVSALGRTSIGGRDAYEDFIQTDASINPGNSGGALVDLEGRLVGINTALISPGAGGFGNAVAGNVGIGFAVPSNMARAVVDQLLEFGEIRRGRLGVLIEEVSPGLAQAYDLEELTGALVTRVLEDSPAEEAGIQAEDVIVSVDDEPVDDPADLRNRIAFSPVGETVRIGILRDGDRIEKEAVIGEMQPLAVAGKISSEKLEGAEFGEIGRDHPWSGRVQGVEVSSIEPGSRAWESGLRRGDIILAVNREAVRSVEEFADTVEEQEDVLALLVQRGGRRMLVVVR